MKPELMHQSVWEYLDTAGKLTMQDVWSDETEILAFNHIWWLHLNWLRHDIGWPHAFKMLNHGDEGKEPERHHRTVNRLIEFVRSTGFGNAHFGLTSSDVEDNARRCQLSIASHLISYDLQDLVAWFHPNDGTKFVQGLQPAFTHWQHAGDIRLGDRMQSWWEPLRIESQNKPIIHGKALGGAVGDRRVMLSLKESFDGIDVEEIQNQVKFKWNLLNLSSPWNLHPIQSSDHIDELDCLNWMAKVASLLYKVAADMRFLASHDWVKVNQPEGYVGSSSIEDKSNPIILEKVCSKCRVVMGFPEQMLQVLSLNGMERTLDTSWQSRYAMSQCSIILGQAINDFRELAPRLAFKTYDSRPSRHAFATKDVINGGETRMDAFRISNQYEQTK